MSDQSTTTNQPTEPKLCKMGCGFFGSNATGDCCSKCYQELQKKEGSTEPAAPSPMEVDAPQVCIPVSAQTAPESAAPAAEENEQPAPVEKKVVKKKKKKTSYKNMMANMTQRSKAADDISTQKEGLRKVTGGGAFSKIDKI